MSSDIYEINNCPDETEVIVKENLRQSLDEELVYEMVLLEDVEL